jgi:hypothetical protein
MRTIAHYFFTGLLFGNLFLFSFPCVQVSLVHNYGNPITIPCTSLSGIVENGVKRRDLNKDYPQESQNDVQARLVHRDDTLREGTGGLFVLFWNVENFYDWRNDSTSVSDQEFSAAGERHWSWKKFQAKANAFAKALFWVEGETGHLPEIVGLAEVENAFVLRQVLQKTALRKTDYRYVHYDSPDRRGIDVALLYRSAELELIDSKPCHLYAANSLLATRDILLCVFRRVRQGSPSVIPGLPRNLPDDAPFAVLVNHHPSKYGGAAESEPRRRMAVERLRALADSLAAAGIDRIIACGDFNDTPANPVFRLLEPALVPMHMDLYHHGRGTIKYDGKWDLIDHFYVSPPLAPPSPSSPSTPARMRILRIPFLLTRDTAHSGEKPLRTYQGPKNIGGVSDHLPILLEVEFNRK